MQLLINTVHSTWVKTT